MFSGQLGVMWPVSRCESLVSACVRRISFKLVPRRSLSIVGNRAMGDTMVVVRTRHDCVPCGCALDEKSVFQSSNFKPQSVNKKAATGLGGLRPEGHLLRQRRRRRRHGFRRYAEDTCHHGLGRRRHKAPGRGADNSQGSSGRLIECGWQFVQAPYAAKGINAFQWPNQKVDLT